MGQAGHQPSEATVLIKLVACFHPENFNDKVSRAIASGVGGVAIIWCAIPANQTISPG